MKGIDPKILVTIIILIAVVLFSVLLATGALGPVEDLLSKQKLSEILGVFNIRAG
ncbi:MAG: hypothetical protein QXD77_00060 [Candidatus Aenigmatarchaeota archaeon]